MTKQHDPYKHMIQGLLAGADDIDDRLSLGQLHALTVDALGAEPLILAAAIHERLSNHRSKLRCQPQTLFDMALKLHDRLYPMPDFRSRKKTSDETQFELEFGWREPEKPQEATP